MTVAAVILAATPEAALADADGLPAVRRVADSAWSGGATPVVVVSADPAGEVAAALAGAPVTLAEPAPSGGPAAQMARGLEVAIADVRDVSAALVWPASMPWVGPETVTSMIEAHGIDRDDVLVPTFEGNRGWPVLVPASAHAGLRRIGAEIDAGAVIDRLIAAASAGAGDRGPSLDLELGDPGVTHDGTTARGDLPPYVGPSGPPVGHVHEWGAALADVPDDAPLEGPALAPYEPARASDIGG